MRQPAVPALAYPLLLLAVAAYAIAFLVVALVSDATAWWWWFIPVFGTVKIFGASVMLGMFHAGIVLVVFVGALLVETSRRGATRHDSRHKSV